MALIKKTNTFREHVISEPCYWKDNISGYDIVEQKNKVPGYRHPAFYMHTIYPFKKKLDR
jgi:hypothetical protein